MLEDPKKVSPLEAKKVESLTLKEAKEKNKRLRAAVVAKIETLPRHVASHPGGHPSRS